MLCLLPEATATRLHVLLALPGWHWGVAPGELLAPANAWRARHGLSALPSRELLLGGQHREAVAAYGAVPAALLLHHGRTPRLRWRRHKVRLQRKTFDHHLKQVVKLQVPGLAKKLTRAFILKNGVLFLYS
jgi:hypothetical protein